MTDSETEQFLEKWGGHIYTLCRGQTRSLNDALDLAQTVRVKIWVSRPETITNAKAFLVTAADHAAISLYRRAYKKHEQLDDRVDRDLEPETRDKGKPDAYDSIEWEALRKASGDEETARAFWLHHVEGYTISEVADKMGLSRKTLDTRMLRLANRLRLLYA